jgi:hypothetical protein
MSSPRPDPIDDDLNPGEYGFSDPPPETREAPPVRPDKYATRDPEGEERPRRRKRRTREGGEGEPPKKRRRDLAAEPPPEPPMTQPWWFWTLVLSGLGFVGLVAAAVWVGAKGGATVGALALAGAVVGVLVETVVVAAGCAVIGAAFGIDYGPAKEAVVKLVGCVAFVNGFTLALGLACYSCAGPLGIFMAISTVSLVTFALFQAQLKLNMYEALLTVLLIEGATVLMAAGIGFTFLRAMLR